MVYGLPPGYTVEITPFKTPIEDSEASNLVKHIKDRATIEEDVESARKFQVCIDKACDAYEIDISSREPLKVELRKLLGDGISNVSEATEKFENCQSDFPIISSVLGDANLEKMLRTIHKTFWRYGSLGNIEG